MKRKGIFLLALTSLLISGCYFEQPTFPYVFTSSKTPGYLTSGEQAPIFTFEFNEELSGYRLNRVLNASSYGGTITVPSYYSGYPVIEIDGYAFYDCQYVTSIVIPDTVIIVDNGAFDCCSELRDISFGKSLRDINFNEALYCPHLESISIHSLNEYYASDDGLVYDKKANELLFCAHGKTGDVVIREGTTSVNNNAFYACSLIETISIPNSLSYLSQELFEYTDLLKAFHVSSDHETLCTQNGILFTKDKTGLLKYPNGKNGTTYIIPDTVVSIGMNAFYGAYKLETMNIPNNVKSIGYQGFARCYNLREITFPDELTVIGDHMFWFCERLKSFTFPSEAGYVCPNMFEDCSDLKYVVVKNKIKGIFANAFNDCYRFDTFYYEGTRAEFLNVEIYNSGVDTNRRYFDETRVAYYSETKPENLDNWHYVNGVPRKWYMDEVVE